MDDGSLDRGRDVRPSGSPASPPTARSVDGRRDRAAGPNGAPSGRTALIYLCNNGGCFTPVDVGGMIVPGAVRPGALHRRADPAGRPADGVGARPLHRVRRPAAAGAERPRVRRPRRLLVHRPRHPRRPRAHQRPHRRSTTPAATARRSARSSSRSRAPNGIGLSPDGDTLYWAETHTGRVFRRRVVGPGELADASPLDMSGAAVLACPGMQYLDSLAVDGEGWVCVGDAVQRRASRRSRRTAVGSSITPPAT